jgi:hypothetical protein
MVIGYAFAWLGFLRGMSNIKEVCHHVYKKEEIFCDRACLSRMRKKVAKLLEKCTQRKLNKSNYCRSYTEK